jgi:hypothetical protein
MEILVAIFVLGVAVMGARLMCRNTAKFQERFPPISDEEFLARCPPGTDPVIALKVRSTLCDALGVDYERIYPESRLIAGLGAE